MPPVEDRSVGLITRSGRCWGRLQSPSAILASAAAKQTSDDDDTVGLADHGAGLEVRDGLLRLSASGLKFDRPPQPQPASTDSSTQIDYFLSKFSNKVAKNLTNQKAYVHIFKPY